MTYAYIRDAALRLIMQYSIAGEQISGSYNNQADYTQMIPQLVDDAMLTITLKYRPLTAEIELFGSETRGKYTVFQMPDDFYSMCGRGLSRFDEDDLVFVRYKRLGNRTLLIPTEETGGMLLLHYYRYPRLLGVNPDPETELDNYPEAQAAIPYYVAACLVRQDNPYAYQTLYNQFVDRLSLLPRPMQFEVGSVVDAYSPDGESV